MKRVTYYLMKGSENDGYYFKPGVTNEQGRERIGLIEDILGDNYDLEHLRNLVKDSKRSKKPIYATWNPISPQVLLPNVKWTCRCSNCGCPQDFKHNYCPNCGAKMDLQKED